LVTVARRRGPGYFSYLLSGVVVPRAAYQVGWSPAAPALCQGFFAAATELAAHRPEEHELASAGWLSGPVSAPADPIDVSAAEALMDSAHRSGIAGLRRAFDSLGCDRDGRLRFTDRRDARKFSRTSMFFAAARDRDRSAFNRRFGTELLTEASARRLLAETKAKVPEGYRNYAPIDFGGGLTIGQIASTDSGTGRWAFFNQHVVGSLVSGKRVLDLGANNGSMPLMMLRAGARRVVAVEYTPAIADFARLNARILAWRDICRYDIDIRTGDMRMFLTGELGEFDVITAFCSLYYLPEADMARIIERAARQRAVLILQANDAIDNLPARRGDLERLMRANGYADVTLHAPTGFTRPLLVGRPERAAA
jgi:2-polyprenyl-3-methyl-5-hydroxy-6-metoxy-1,4-benzoquinol methylase